MPYADPEVQKAYVNEWIKRRRLEWIADNGPCAICGSSVDLEVDHRDPSTKVSHRVWSWSKVRRDVELAKCQVLCCACHLAKSISEKGRPAEHGTHAGYARHGCRCSDCRHAHAAYNAERRRVARAGFEPATSGVGTRRPTTGPPCNG